MRPSTENSPTSSLETYTMRLWMIGIFYLAAVQVIAPAAEANKTAGAAVETSTAAAVKNTLAFSTVAAVRSTHMTAAVVNNTVAAVVETTTAGVGNNTSAAVVESMTAAAGSNSTKVTVNNTNATPGDNTLKVAFNNTGVAGGDNTLKIAINNTGMATGNKIDLTTGDEAGATVGFNLRKGVGKKPVKVSVRSTTVASLETSGVPVLSTTWAAGNSAADFDTHERSLRHVRSVGNEPLHAAFTDKIKKWFRKIKNRLLGKDKIETTTSASDEQPTPVVTLDKEDLLFIRRNPRRFNVDLTTLTFDLKRDWGFRLGRWVIIRKVSPWKKPEGWSRGSQGTIPTDDASSEVPATASSTIIQRCPPYTHHTPSPAPFEAKTTGPPMLTAAPRSTSFEKATPNPSGTTAAAPSMLTAASRSTNSEEETPNLSGTTVPSMMTAAPRSTKIEEATPSSEAPVEGTSKKSNTENKRRDQSAEVLGPTE